MAFLLLFPIFILLVRPTIISILWGEIIYVITSFLIQRGKFHLHFDFKFGLVSIILAVLLGKEFYDKWLCSSKVIAISGILHLQTSTLLVICTILLSLLSCFGIIYILGIITELFFRREKTADKATNLNSNMNYKIEFAILAFSILLGTFVFLLKSPLNPLIKACAATDSSVFKTIALMMEKGYMPYRDSFDHKGPLLFIINFLGNKISYYTGVWVIEYIFLTITFSALYRIARLFCNIWQSIVALLSSIALLLTYFEGGNLTEEYAMMFIAAALYIFIDYFNNQKITRVRLIVCGATFAGTLLLRPNMIAVWFVMCLAVLINSIAAKKYKDLINFIGWFLLGAAIIIIPIYIWLWQNDALQSFWEDYIVFNGQYSSAAGGRALFSAKYESFVYFISTKIYITVLILQIYACYKRKNIFNFAYLALMFITPLFICVSGMTYPHYGMIMIPILVYPIANAFSVINSHQAAIKKTLCIIACTVFVYICYNAYLSFAIDTKNNVSLINKDNIPANIKEICSTIDDYGIDEDEPISVYGNWDIVYVLSKRPHATTYSYQFPIGQVMPSIMDEYMSQLEEELPKAIVVADGKYDDNISEFLEKHDYKLVWADIEEPLLEYAEETEDECARLYIRQ